MLYLQLNVIRMFRQLDYFEEHQRRVQAIIGPQRTRQLINQALVLITVGGNDFVNNYYLVPYSARSRQYSLPDYVKYLISEYKKLLMVNSLLSSYILSGKDFNSKVYSFYMHCYCHCRGYTNWEHKGFLWRVPDQWVVFRQSWPCGVLMADAQPNCKEPPPCTTHNSFKCYKNSIGKSVKTCSLLQILNKCTWISSVALKHMVWTLKLQYFNFKLVFNSNKFHTN